MRDVLIGRWLETLLASASHAACLLSTWQSWNAGAHETCKFEKWHPNSNVRSSPKSESNPNVFISQIPAVQVSPFPPRASLKAPAALSRCAWQDWISSVSSEIFRADSFLEASSSLLKQPTKHLDDLDLLGTRLLWNLAKKWIIDRSQSHNRTFRLFLKRGSKTWIEPTNSTIGTWVLPLLNGARWWLLTWKMWFHGTKDPSLPSEKNDKPLY